MSQYSLSLPLSVFLQPRLRSFDFSRKFIVFYRSKLSLAISFARYWATQAGCERVETDISYIASILQGLVSTWSKSSQKSVGTNLQPPTQLPIIIHSHHSRFRGYNCLSQRCEKKIVIRAELPDERYERCPLNTVFVLH